MIAVASDRGRRTTGAFRRSALIREPAGLDSGPDAGAEDLTTSDVVERTRAVDELTWGDLICAVPLSPVVSLQETAQFLHEAAGRGVCGESDFPANPLPEPLTAEMDGVVRSYVSAKQESCGALSSILGCLAGDTGRGFLLSGLHGSGKSHLLCVLALLSAVPEAWTPFTESHPPYEPLVPRFRAGPLLAVPVSLEAHRAGCEDLEDIVFAAAEAALDGFPEGRSSCLSAAAFSLALAETHLLPLYEDQFGGWLEDRCGGLDEWKRLGRSDPAAAAGLAQEFSREAGIPLEWHEPRRERLRRLLEISRRCGRRGVVILLDEMSLYLAGKPREPFYGDVSFLQFLGQQSAYFPLWIVGAVQRGLEELGDIDAEMLRKLKDRYVWDLSLPMAQVGQVLRERVVHCKDERNLAAVIRQLRQSRTDSQGGANASLEPGAADDLTECYPLDPLALECLAAASGRFFSKTRSVVEFVQHVVREGGSRKAVDLIGPDEVFARFWPAAADYPELAPAAAAYRHYSGNIRNTVPEDPNYALRLLGALGALSLAGLRRSLQEVVVSLGPADGERKAVTEAPGCCSMPGVSVPGVSVPGAAVPGAILPGAGERAERPAQPQGLPLLKRAHDILERLRQDEGYVDVARGGSPGEDVYFLDPAYDVARIVRRRIAVCSAGIKVGDSRVREAAYAAADSALPLSSLSRGVQVEVEWLTARHTVAIARRDLRQWSAADAAAEINWLSDPRQPETLRLFVGELCDPQGQRQRFLQAVRQASDTRWRSGITAWLPRGLRPQEEHLLRSHAAFRLVIEDPTLRLTAIGRQVLEKLRAEQPERNRAVRDVVLSAYSGGELIGAGGTIATSADLCRRPPSLEAAASLAAARVFPALFPDYPAVAPRRTVAGENLTTLLDQFIIPGAAAVSPGSPLEGLIRDIAAPLGIVTMQGGESRVCVPRAEILDLVLASIPEGESPDWRTVAGRLARSRFGLTAGQVDLLGAVLCKKGFLEACDRDGAALPVRREALPLSRHARLLRRGDTPGAALAARLAAVLDALDAGAASGDPAGPELLWARLLALRSELDSFAEQDSLETLTRDLSTPAAPCSGLQPAEGKSGWSASLELIAELRTQLQQIDPAANSWSGSRLFLESMDGAAVERLAALYRGWRSVQQFTLEHGPQLVSVLRYLEHPGVCVPDDSDLEQRILRFSQAARGGESILSRGADAVRYGNSLAQRYRDGYIRWHRETFGLERFSPYRACAGSPEWRALGQIDRLPLGAPLLPEIQSIVDEQMARHCSGAGLAASLIRSPVCLLCRLPAGAGLHLVSPEAIVAQLRKALDQKLTALSAAPQLTRLQYHHEHRMVRSSPEYGALSQVLRLLERLQTGGLAECLTDDDVAALGEQLDDPLLREMRMALVGSEPRRRSLGLLRERLTGRELTRADAARVFAGWLDPDGSLGPEAFVLVED